jgi:hypothetical protein
MKNIKLSSIFVLLLSSHGAHANSPWLEGIPQKLSPEAIKRISQGMSLSRPNCPVNGKSMPDRSGVLFDGKIFYFHNVLTKRTVVKALTGQSDNLDIDVIKNLIIPREDFDGLKVTVLNNGESFERYQLKIKEEGPALELSRPVFIIVLKELGKAFGLSDEEILKKINLLLGLEPTE